MDVGIWLDIYDKSLTFEYFYTGYISSLIVLFLLNFDILTILKKKGFQIIPVLNSPLKSTNTSQWDSSFVPLTFISIFSFNRNDLFLLEHQFYSSSSSCCYSPFLVWYIYLWDRNEHNKFEDWRITAIRIQIEQKMCA